MTSARAAVLKKPDGVIIYQLVTSPTQHPDVQYVQGEVVLREGLYVTDQDVHLLLEGVYIRTQGRLKVVMNSDMQELLADADLAGKDHEYRAALRQVAMDAVWHGRLPATTSVNTSLTGAETLTPHRVHGYGFSSQAAALESDPKALNLTMRKRCTFTLDGTLEDSTLIDEEAAARNGTKGAGKKKPKRSAQEAAVGRRGGVGEGRNLPVHNLAFEGLLTSPNCGVELRINTTSIQLQAYYNKAINYTLLVTCISLLQVVLLVRQMDYTNTQAAVAKMSLMMIGQQSIMDAYLCLLHLTVAIVMEQLFNVFATAAFFEFLTFSLFEMRYMLMVWKARQNPQIDSWGSLRRELSMLYSRFYGLLLFGLIFIYQMQGMMRYVLFVFYSFWWPQIVRNATHDLRRPLQPQYILGMTATRLAIPLYIYGCPHNFLRQAPDHTFCIYLVAYVTFQALLLLVQHYFGPRSFMPAGLFPAKYNYFRKVDAAVEQTAREAGASEDPGAPGDVETGAEDVDCVICMNGIQISNHSRRMVTPCNHFFHPQCLQHWMDVKMECPTCRRALPPL